MFFLLVAESVWAVAKDDCYDKTASGRTVVDAHVRQRPDQTLLCERIHFEGGEEIEDSGGTQCTWHIPVSANTANI